MKLVLTICLFIVGATAQECLPIASRDGDAIDYLRCVYNDKSTGALVPVNVEDCGDHDHCCQYFDFFTQESICVVNGSSDSSTTTINQGSVKAEFYVESNATSEKATELTIVNERSLGFPIGIPGIPTQCIPPPIFPATCKPSRNEPYVLEPPVDVPYCLRIPCDPLNPLLNKNIKACGSQPGCYFDQALFEYREAFGPSVLPGVPVCQLAIRNRFFREKAQTVINKFGAWNPYFTNCLLNEYRAEIQKGPKGCELLPILDAFYVVPKMAGWTDITSTECAYIDGCWRPGYGCFYPVDISNIRVKSAQKKFFNKDEIIYGRPKCQVFDNSSPLNTLKSYHRCLSAGCTVDSSVTSLYYQHIFSLGNQLVPQDHWQYWSAVEKGLIGAHNIGKSLSEYTHLSSTGILPTHAPVTTTASAGNPFDGIFGGGSFGAGSAGSSGSSNPFGPPPGGFSFQPIATSPSSIGCGFPFKGYGGRPCAPPTITLSKPNKYCPYKPFFVPRFPKLTGSFKGCCDINLCYLPKAEISKMHSGPSIYYSEWSLFSECSVSCGVGKMMRYRKCISDDRKLCTEKLEDVKSCFKPACGRWGPWSGYTPCPKTCFPGGVSSRTRVCLPPGATCGVNKEKVQEQVKKCNTHPCFVIG